jgi:hypothetical protein
VIVLKTALMQIGQTNCGSLNNFILHSHDRGVAEWPDLPYNTIAKLQFGTK